MRWDAACYVRNAVFVPTLGAQVIELLAPQPGERILDLGCGDGRLTEEIARRGAYVVGVDSSAEMIAVARSHNLEVRCIAGEQLGYKQEFDAVFSNAALHWMSLPDVVQGVFRALKPGGRFVGELGGHGNIAAIRIALACVLARHGVDCSNGVLHIFPSSEEWQELLETAGLVVSEMQIIPRPTPLAAGMRAWLELFATDVIAVLPESERAAALDEVEALLIPVLRDYRGNWIADYMRLRFRATRPL